MLDRFRRALLRCLSVFCLGCAVWVALIDHRLDAALIFTMGAAMLFALAKSETLF